MTAPTIFARATVTIDTVSDRGAWKDALRWAAPLHAYDETANDEPHRADEIAALNRSASPSLVAAPATVNNRGAGAKFSLLHMTEPNA